MIIGNFTYDNGNDSFTGDICTLQFQFNSVEISPAKKTGDKSPDYRLTSDTTYGQVELGAGWKRKSENERDFISISLDGPMLDAPVSAALFMDPHGTEASWSGAARSQRPESRATPSLKRKLRQRRLLSSPSAPAASAAGVFSA